MADTLRSKASEHYTKARKKAAKALAEGRSKAVETLDSGAKRARRRAEDAKQRTARGVDANPLAAVAGGLAIGALLASLLPRTAREDKYIGPVSRTVKSTAKGAATVTERMRITSDGGIQIGTTTAEHSSLDSTCLLQMNSTSRGFRPPAMTTTQRNAIVGPMQGLIIYNATTGKLNFFSGTSSAWEVITSAPGA